MDEQGFQDKMTELMRKIRELPGDRVSTTSDESGDLTPDDDAGERRERIQASIAELQESLDYLRLTVKYLVFDLEATRRENAYLRRLIERNDGRKGSRGAGEDEREPDIDDLFE